MALPEKSPPKSMTLRTLLRFLSVDLKSHIHSIRLINIRARRSIDLKSRIDAPSGKVDTIHDSLTVGLGWPTWPVDALFKS